MIHACQLSSILSAPAITPDDLAKQQRFIGLCKEHKAAMKMEGERWFVEGDTNSDLMVTI